MKNKKGQTAMEFLMTYGWAILVVLGVIGSLAYFGVLTPSIPQTESEYCNSNIDLSRCYCFHYDLEEKNNINFSESTKVRLKRNCTEYKPIPIHRLSFEQLEERYDCLDTLSCRERFPEQCKQDILKEMIHQQQNSMILLYNEFQEVKDIAKND